MKILSPALQAHLDSGATTLCWCWRIVSKDGVVQGFTDHDHDVDFDGTTFEAAAGFTASDITDSLGLAVGNLEVTGALSSATLNEDDLAAGRYDDAKIEIFRVNRLSPADRVLMRQGSLGEVKRSGSGFAAEVRGLAHYLQQPKGRLYQYTCDADLGDTRCGIDLNSPTYKGTATVTGVLSPRRFTVSGLDAYTHDFFSRGLATFLTGAATGLKIEVKSHSSLAGVVTVELWSEAEGPPGIDDTFSVTAGCDKRLDTCQARFANAANFRGFPSMPGNDFVTQVARSSK